MMEKRLLELPFRGERDYLHGTDLYMAVKEAMSPVFAGPISINYHALLKRQPDLIWSSENPRAWRKDPGFRGELRIGSGDASVCAVLIESEREVQSRKSCNEQEVIASAILMPEAKAAVLEKPETGNAIETVVFLNKWLHLKMLPHLSPKWLFARLDLQQPLSELPPDQLKIELEQVLADRFTRSGIVVNGSRVGSISFSVPQ